MKQDWDVFICHASEDKESFVKPLAQSLRRLGISVWYDEFVLEVGDSLTRAIDKGIAKSGFGIVVISKSFIGKAWPEHELSGLVNRSIEEDLKILPVWHGVTKQEVRKFSPSLSDKWAIDTRRDDAQEAAIKILRVVRPDLYRAHPRAELEKLASGAAIIELQSEIEELRDQLSDFQCPYCSSPLGERVSAPVDEEQKHWDQVEVYECGYQTFAGEILHPCPSDPKFPKLEDYDFIFDAVSDEPGEKWQCHVLPKTSMARKVSIDTGYGKTKEQAKRKVEANYQYLSGQINNREWIDILIGRD